MKTGSFVLLFSLFTLHSFSQNKPKATLNHIALYVADLKKSTAFYQDIIGLDSIPEPFHDGKHAWFSIGQKSHLHLIEGATASLPHPKNAHLCFTVNSVNDFIEQLKKHGLSYENWVGEKMAVTIRVDGVKQIYFRDPDGYWVEVNDARQ